MRILISYVVRRGQAQPSAGIINERATWTAEPTYVPPRDVYSDVSTLRYGSSSLPCTGAWGKHNWFQVSGALVSGALVSCAPVPGAPVSGAPVSGALVSGALLMQSLNDNPNEKHIRYEITSAS